MPLDIGIGIILGLLVNSIFGLELELNFALLGALFALFPDIDYLLTKLSSSRSEARHREVLHRPLLLVPFGTLLLLLINLPIAVLFALGTLAHLMHDSIGIGWGVAWLYPFNKNAFSFFYHLSNNNGKPRPDHKLMHIWHPSKIDHLHEEFGDPNWIKNIYFKFHPYAIVEYAIFVIGISLLIIAIH
jgi:hypothetical protein